jgi:hypothetical protein
MGVTSVPDQMFLMTILGLARQIDVVSTWMRSPAALLKAFLLRPGTYRVSQSYCMIDHLLPQMYIQVCSRPNYYAHW